MRFADETRELERLLKEYETKLAGGASDSLDAIGVGGARISLTMFLWDNKKGFLHKLQMAEQLRAAVAELLSQDVPSWPDHGNDELAIAAAVAILVGRERKMREALVATQELITTGLGDGTFVNGRERQREVQASEVLELVLRAQS